MTDCNYKPSKEFVEDIARLAVMCAEHGTDSMDISFALNDGRKAVVELTFRVEDGDQA